MEHVDNDDFDSNHALLMVTTSNCTNSVYWYFGHLVFKPLDWK